MRAAWGLLLALAACEDDRERMPLRQERAELAHERAQLDRDRDSIRKQEELLEAETRRGLKSADIDPALASVIVIVPAQGDPVVDGRSLDQAQLEQVFRAAVARDPKTQIVIQADRGVGHGVVVKIMELAKAVGLTRLAIGTR